MNQKPQKNHRNNLILRFLSFLNQGFLQIHAIIFLTNYILLSLLQLLSLLSFFLHFKTDKNESVKLGNFYY